MVRVGGEGVRGVRVLLRKLLTIITIPRSLKTSIVHRVEKLYPEKTPEGSLEERAGSATHSAARILGHETEHVHGFAENPAVDAVAGVALSRQVSDGLGRGVCPRPTE